MKEFSTTDLDRVTGGNAPQCTPTNPTGLKQPQYWENNPPHTPPPRPPFKVRTTM